MSQNVTILCNDILEIISYTMMKNMTTVTTYTFQNVTQLYITRNKQCHTTLKHNVTFQNVHTNASHKTKYYVT